MSELAREYVLDLTLVLRRSGHEWTPWSMIWKVRTRRPGWIIALVTGFIAIGVAVYLWHNVKHIDQTSAIVGVTLNIIGLGLTAYGLVPRRHEPTTSSHIINQRVSSSTIYGPVTQIADGTHRKRRDG